jgi:tetratricopeptide (TPR) repeat protein
MWARIATGVVVLVVAGLLAVTAYRYSDRPERHFELGLQALEAHDLRRLRAEALALQGRSGFEPHARLLQGAWLLRVDKPRDALEELKDAVEHPQTRFQALVLAGEALCRVKQYRQAEQVLREALGIDPEHAAAHRWMAAIYYDLGAINDALHHLEKLGDLAQDDPRPYRLMGLIYKDLEEYSRAETAYQESLRRSRRQPDLQEILVELATVQVKLNRYEATLNTLSSCRPSPEVLTLRAECHLFLGRSAQAKELVDRALEEAHQHVPALLLQGAIRI